MTQVSKARSVANKPQDVISDLDQGATRDRVTDDTSPVSATQTRANSDLIGTHISRKSKHSVDLGGTFTTADSKTLNQKGSKYQSSCLPRLMRKLEEYDESVTPTINIVGMGSSVGNGATLPTPATQAPVQKFGEYFESKFNKLGYLNVVTTNESVDGSTISESLAKFDAIIAGGLIPDVLVLAYGMNDGATAIFNSGQTYPFVYADLVSLIEKARAQDCDVILMTTPHPHTGRESWSMPAGVPQIYPTSVADPVPDESLIPPVSTSIKTIDALGYGAGNEIAVSHRHYRVNESMRRVSVDMGIPLIDIERYWFEAVYSNGEDDLFDAGESVHPNLTGHTRSYWLGIYEFIEALTESAQLGTQQNYLFGPKLGINQTLPSAVLHGKQLAATDVLMKLEDTSGDVAIDVDENGILNGKNRVQNLGPTVTQTKYNVYPTPTYTLENSSKLNIFVNVATVQNILTTSNSFGTVLIKSLNSGIGTQVDYYLYSNIAGTITLTSIASSGAAVSTVSVSGNNITVTPIAANTNIDYVLNEALGT